MDARLAIGKQAQEFLDRRQKVFHRLRACAISLEPLLRDLNHQNSADRIAAILGEIDANEAEEQAWTQANSSAIAFALLGLPPDFRL